MKEKYRIAILGCGGIANAHATNLSKHPRVQLAAFCDVENSRTAQFNRDYAGGKAEEFSDPIPMFDRIKPDIAWICLPPFAHHGQLEAAAQRGIHVFVEKPISLDMKRAESMVAAVEKAKVKSLVGFLNRFGGAVEKLKADLNSGKAGKPGVMQATYHCNSLHSPWWREKSKSGGQILEQIIHAYDLTRYFFGKARSIYTYAHNQFHQKVDRYTAEDISASVISFENGAVATVTGSNGAIPGRWDCQWRVVNEFLTADFENPNKALFYDTHDHENVDKCLVESPRVLFRSESDDLFGAIDQNRETRCPISDGAKTQKLVLAACESAEKGVPVALGV